MEICQAPSIGSQLSKQCSTAASKKYNFVNSLAQLCHRQCLCVHCSKYVVVEKKFHRSKINLAHYAKIIVVIHSVLLTYVAAHLLQESILPSKATKAVKAARGGRGGRRGRGRDDGIAPRCHPLSGDQSHPLPTSDDRHKEKKFPFPPPFPLVYQRT